MDAPFQTLVFPFFFGFFSVAIIYYLTFLVTVYKIKENVTLLLASGDNFGTQLFLPFFIFKLSCAL